MRRRLAGLRDRALLLTGFAGARRRSKLVGLDVEHIRPTTIGIRLMIPRLKTDAAGERAEIGIARSSHAETRTRASCLAAYRGNRWRTSFSAGDTVGRGRHQAPAPRRGAANPAPARRRHGSKGTLLEPVTPHGHASRVCHDGLQQRRAGRGDHGSHPTLQSGHHEKPRATRKARRPQSAPTLGGRIRGHRGRRSSNVTPSRNQLGCDAPGTQAGSRKLGRASGTTAILAAASDVKRSDSLQRRYWTSSWT